MTEGKYAVYKHTSPGGKVYIGVTMQDPSRRWSNGSGYRRNKHLWAAIKTYGWENFRHEIIAEGLTKDTAETLEIELIASYESTNPEKGYNHSTGGKCNSGVRVTETARKNMSAAKIGHPVSMETRAKLRLAQKGRTASAATREKMSNTRKQIIKEHPELIVHLHQAKREYKPITEDTRRKLKAARNMRGPVTETTRKKTSETIREQKARSVMCLESGEKFQAIIDAARAKGLRGSHISEVCGGKRKTAGGLHWVYIKED